MQPDHALLVYEHVLINVAFITSVLFTPVVSVFWPWWDEPWGQNIVVLELCIAGSLLSSWLFIDFGINALVFQWFTAACLTLVPLIIAWRMMLIWKAQRLAAAEQAARDADLAGP